MIDSRIAQTTKLLVEWLVNGEYERLAAYSREVRLTAEQIARAVHDYGHKLRLPPTTAFESLDVVEVTGSSPRKWSVRCDLWTQEEGKSDLSLEMTLIDHGLETLSAEVDNLHVL
jgi:hypothetical protein